MKIIYLHQYFNTPSMMGGTRSYEMARRMVLRGHEVHMITSRRELNCESYNWQHEVIDGINVHWLPVYYNNKMSFIQRIKAFVSFAIRSANRALEVGGDIVFATSTPLTIAIPAVHAKKKLSIPLVFEVRDLWPELPIAIGALKSPIAIYFAKKLEKYAYFNSAHVIGLSPGMCEGVARTGYPESRISNIPNSCDLSLFKINPRAGDDFRAQRAWLGERKLVLYTGTLGIINGVSWLVDLASEMYRLDPEVRFLVLGEGAEEDIVRERAIDLEVWQKNFFMESRIPKREVPKALQAASICSSLFIPLPEMWANSANKFFDTLAAGKPILINYKGWQEDIIRRENNGLVLSPQATAYDAQLLLDLLNDSERLFQCGKNSSLVAEREFSRDELASQLIDVLERNYRSNNKSPN